MPQNAWHRREAIHIAAQVNGKTIEDRLKILDLARELIGVYLPGGELPAKSACPEPRRASLWWVLPALAVGGVTTKLLHMGAPLSGLTPFSPLIALMGLIFGARHALLLTGFAFVLNDFAFVTPFYVWTYPSPREWALLGMWAVMSLTVPWCASNLCRVRKWFVSIEDRALHRDLPGRSDPKPVSNLVTLPRRPQVPFAD